MALINLTQYSQIVRFEFLGESLSFLEINFIAHLNLTFFGNMILEHKKLRFKPLKIRFQRFVT